MKKTVVSKPKTTVKKESGSAIKVTTTAPKLRKKKLVTAKPLDTAAPTALKKKAVTKKTIKPKIITPKLEEPNVVLNQPVPPRPAELHGVAPLFANGQVIAPPEPLKVKEVQVKEETTKEVEQKKEFTSYSALLGVYNCCGLEEIHPLTKSNTNDLTLEQKLKRVPKVRGCWFFKAKEDNSESTAKLLSENGFREIHTCGKGITLFVSPGIKQEESDEKSKDTPLETG